MEVGEAGKGGNRRHAARNRKLPARSVCSLEPEQFAGLCAALKVSPPDLVKRALVCGFKCTAAKKGEDGEQRYRISLMKGPDSGKTLAELFPKDKKLKR